MRLFTLANDGGIRVRVTEYGGIILSLLVPDRDGRPGDVVLGYDAPEDYRDNPAHLGGVIGRYANRITDARFTLDGRVHEVTPNLPPHHLHGGDRGFDAVMWAARPVRDAQGDALVLEYTSPAGEEGFPGTLDVQLRYTVTPTDRVVIDYRATTDAPTPVNLTQHSYFNLAGHDAGDILDHELRLDADAFTPVGPSVIPTGEVRDVAGTALDFRTPTRVGDRIDADDEQIRRGEGYDHNYVLRPPEADGLRSVGQLYDPESGRVLTVRTTEPGVQLYTGNHLDGLAGKAGARYTRRTGLCLETQHFPDSPNQPAFPSTVLRPGEMLRSRTVWDFSTRRVGEMAGPAS